MLETFEYCELQGSQNFLQHLIYIVESCLFVMTILSLSAYKSPNFYKSTKGNPP